MRQHRKYRCVDWLRRGSYYSGHLYLGTLEARIYYKRNSNTTTTCTTTIQLQQLQLQLLLGSRKLL